MCRDRIRAMVNKDDFFREFTIRICSSLIIQTAITNVFEYLKEILPLDILLLVRCDDTLSALRRIAFAPADYVDIPAEIIAVPECLWGHANIWDKHHPYIVDSQDEPSSQLTALAKTEEYSHLIVPLWIDEKLPGYFSLLAKGGGKFNQAHAELLDTIAQPAAIALANALAHENLIRYRDILIDDNRFLNKELLHISNVDIIGADSGLKNVIELIQQVATRNNTVLLLGETGTGKELIANAVHFASQRKDGPFIKVNCGAIPESLIDSELFGHEKGAFTGATSEKRGRFERADGGTIFLDEIAELPLQAQVRLLRVLQNREIERVGGTRSIPVNIRIIAATHRNLENMVAEKTFREDLWFRLNVFPLIIPPLRQRKDDIPPLVRYFLESKSLELGLGISPALAPGALKRLTEYPWPGNVRELENLVERELIRYRGGLLSFDTLTPSQATMSSAAQLTPITDCITTNLDEINHAHISMVLNMADGKIHGPGGAAELLGVNGNTLRARMDKLGINYKRTM